MLNWHKVRDLLVFGQVRFKKGATLVTENSDGSTTSMDVAELAALNDLGAADLAKIDGITNGTVTASKAAVVDANKDIGDFRNLDAVNIDAGASGTAGTVDVFPTTASKGKFILSCTDQDGDTSVTLKPAAMGQASVVSIPDPGAATANVVLTDAANDGAVVTATAAELNRSCDTSARVVTTTATALSLTVTEHAERVVLINTNSTVANTFTLPAAAGTGEKFTLVNNIAQTQGTVVIAANGTDVFSGICYALDSTAAADAMTFLTTATSDKVTLNLTTTGGLGKDWFEAWDVAANTWLVKVAINGSGSLATPFSET